MILPSVAGRSKRGRCPHSQARHFRRQHEVAGEVREHVGLFCALCGANVNGPGKWLKRSSVPNADALPLLPGPEAPRQAGLFDRLTGRTA
jgi:hypothetical protein